MASSEALTLPSIVVGVARGGSEAAVRLGAAEAVRTGRPLDLVHIAPDTEGWAAVIGYDSLLVASRWAHQDGDSLVVRSRLLRGSVVPTLVEVAAGSPLVVVERRRAADRRRREESTTTSVADATEVPVLVVPGNWWDARHAVVTLGIDPWVVDDAAVRGAIFQARLRGAVLRVLVAGAGGSQQEVADRLDRLGSDACDLAIERTDGPPETALVTATTSSDLLVLGRHRPDPYTGSRLGPVARQVLREASCPVLLTRPTHVHSAPFSKDEGPEPTRSAVSGRHEIGAQMLETYPRRS